MQQLDKSTENVGSFNKEYLEEHLNEQFEEHSQEEIQRTDSSSFTSTPIENVAVPSCSGYSENNKKLESLTTQLFLLRALMADTLQEVKSLWKDMITGRAAEDQAASLFTKHKIQFPLSTIEALNEFNKILNTECEFKDTVKELADYGGADNYNFVKRLLTALISNEVAILYSWLSRKGKEDIHRLNIARLVILQQHREKWLQMTRKLSCPYKDG